MRSYDIVSIGAIIVGLFVGASLQAKTWYVEPNDKIQAIIEIAKSGDTIEIHGHHVEQISILGKNLSFIGGSQAQIIAPETLYANQSKKGDWDHALAYVENAQVSFKHIVFDGRLKGNQHYRYLGLYYRNAGGEISHCQIKHIWNRPLSNHQHGVAIFVKVDKSPKQTVIIHHNQISAFQKNGITLSAKPIEIATQEARLYVRIYQNTIVGAGMTAKLAQNGIQLSGFITGAIFDNLISDVAYSGQDSASAGILLDHTQGIQVRNNHITDCNPAIHVVANHHSEITGNHLEIYTLDPKSQDTWGILVSGDHNLIQENQIINYRYGIYIGSPFYGITQDTLLINNRVQALTASVVEFSSAIVENTKILERVMD